MSASGPAATLGRLWAVARLTLIEAVRRRVFILLLLFGAAIVSSATFFPATDAPSRLRLIEVWSVRASLLFSVIVAIFLAGYSLPSDFETRRVYTLVTKPIHKATLFGGKLFGFFLLLALFLFCMAVISVGYIRVVAALSKDFPPLTAYPRFQPSELTGRGSLMRLEGSDRFGVREPASALVWRFRGLDRGDFPEGGRLRVRANLGRVGKQYAFEGTVVVRAGPPGATPAFTETIDAYHTNQEHELQLPASVLTEGALDVELSPREKDLTIDAGTKDAVLVGAGRSFEINYLKGMLLVLFQSTVVMTTTLAASTFLTAPVSVVLGVFVYVIGMMWTHIHEGVQDIDVQMEQFRRALAQGGEEEARTPEDLPPWILAASTAVSRVALTAVPDFARFNFSDYLLSDHAVMPRDLAGGFLTMAVRVAVLALLGLVMIWRRDFAT